VGEREYAIRPEAVIWAEYPTDLIVGFTLLIPESPPVAVSNTLREAMKRPLEGPPRRPDRVRMADADLAAEIATDFEGTLDVVVGPTPELDAILKTMEQMLPGDGAELSYFDGGGSVEDVAALFSAAAGLARLKPWSILGGISPIRLDIPDLAIRGAALVVIGDLDESRGVLLFPSREGYEDFLDAAMLVDDGGTPLDVGTSLLSLSFEHAEALPSGMRREAMAHGWPVAGPEAYPLVDHRDSDGVPRVARSTELKLMAICAEVLAAFVERHGERLSLGMRLVLTEKYSAGESEAWLTLPAEGIPGCAPEPGCRMELELRPPARRKRKPKR
jgi:hypothetical protein